MKNLAEITEKNLPKIFDYHEKNRAFYISDFEGLEDEFFNKYDCERIATYMENHGLIDWDVERVHLTEFGENVIKHGNWLSVQEKQKKREEEISNSAKEKERLELDLAKSNLEANRINAIEAKRNQRDRKHNRITTWINIAIGILNFGILIWQILKNQ